MTRGSNVRESVPKVVAGGDPFFWEALEEINSRTRGFTGSYHCVQSRKARASYGRPGERQKTWREKVVRLLDAACGIKRVDQKRYVGKTLTAYAGCKALPIYLVRPVEIESLARRLNRTEMDIGRIHNFLVQLEDGSKGEKLSWEKKDILNKGIAIDYLMRATLVGNKFARRVLEWIAPVRAKGINPSQGAAHAEYVRAISAGQHRRAIQIGCLIIGGETGKTSFRPDDEIVLAMPATAREAMAANNIGYLLLHGRGGVSQNVQEAVKYFEIAVRLGSASAANNLGHVYFSGAGGEVMRDGRRAKEMYMLAIERGERTKAPRNLAILLLRGGPGLKIDTSSAVHWLLLGLCEHDSETRRKCKMTLCLATHSWRFWFIRRALKRQCMAALHGVDLKHTVEVSSMASLLDRDLI